MKIGDFDVSKKVLIVAEIGNNHEGKFSLAKRMVNEAADCGADAVKFQTFKADKYVTTTEYKRHKQLTKFQLTYKQFRSLSRLAYKKGLIFLSTPFDLDSVDALNPFVPAFKISSGDNTFWHLIRKIAMKKKPVILSTGMASVKEIKKGLDILRKFGRKKPLKKWVSLLHCVSSYPVPAGQVNLASVDYLSDKFNLLAGYSDHSIDITACLAAVARGARIIEKHFTYSKRNQKFQDHYLSADPSEFEDMVRKIRQIEMISGKYMKKTMPCEYKLKINARRSIAAGKAISKNKRIVMSDIIWVRPAVGFKVGQEHLVIGKKSTRNIKRGEIIKPADLVS